MHPAAQFDLPLSPTDMRALLRALDLPLPYDLQVMELAQEDIAALRDALPRSVPADDCSIRISNKTRLDLMTLAMSSTNGCLGEQPEAFAETMDDLYDRLNALVDPGT